MSNPIPPWKLDDTVFSTQSCQPDAQWLRKLISKSQPKISSHIMQSGLNIDETNDRLTLFDSAAAAIDKVADLAEITRARVGHIHILTAPPGYDVSHSEPQWPDRIFVSVPERSDGVGALRLAENVVHEAMHLHLTVFEQGTSLVRDKLGEIYSPWRHSLRSYGGVVHGLFVFSCLREYFGRLPNDCHGDVTNHIRQRVEDIDSEIAQIDIRRLTAGLSAAGLALATNLLGLHRRPQ